MIEIPQIVLLKLYWRVLFIGTEFSTLVNLHELQSLFKHASPSGNKAVIWVTLIENCIIKVLKTTG